ncbi:hypothetical protein KXV75_007352, partial [Aspergillus fumigatus]
MPASVEADGHVRVAASVPVDGARLSGADKGARAPANWSPLAPPVSVWVSLDPVSVPGARRPTGHPRCLRVCRSASVCPWRAPSLRRPRARDSLLASRARAYRAPSPPQPTPLNRDPRARRRRPFSYTYPPTSPGPSSCAQTFPGPNVVPGGGPPAPADRAPPVRPCAPANWSLPF